MENFTLKDDEFDVDFFQVMVPFPISGKDLFTKLIQTQNGPMKIQVLKCLIT